MLQSYKQKSLKNTNKMLWRYKEKRYKFTNKKATKLQTKKLNVTNSLQSYKQKIYEVTDSQKVTNKKLQIYEQKSNKVTNKNATNANVKTTPRNHDDVIVITSTKAEICDQFSLSICLSLCLCPGSLQK